MKYIKSIYEYENIYDTLANEELSFLVKETQS